jgi:pyruvate carboxylase subunit B
VDEFRAHHGPVIAQVPGVVLDVRAKANEQIGAHEPIIVIEAMKIEMPVSLPVDAKITAIHVKAGDRIQPGQTLVTWEPK